MSREPLTHCECRCCEDARRGIEKSMTKSDDFRLANEWLDWRWRASGRISANDLAASLAAKFAAIRRDAAAERVAALEGLLRRAQGSLEEAVEAIRAWHDIRVGPNSMAWPIYRDHSPEMKRITETLAALRAENGGGATPARGKGRRKGC